jgi:O-glycosyl hydrolase
MKKLTRTLVVFGAAVTLFALIFASCEMDNPEGKKPIIVPGTEFPVITRQTTYETFFEGGLDTNPIKISVTAILQPGVPGTLSYQWFKSDTKNNTGGEKLDNAAVPEYTLTGVTGAGTYYYYAEVTNSYGDGQKATTPSEPVTVVIKATENVTAQNTVTVDITTKHQYIRGFGGMSTPWDNAPDDNVNDFETMFNPNKLGFNISRIMIPPDNVDIDEMMRALVANETRFSGSYFYTNAGLPERNKDHSTYYEKVKIVNKYGGYVLASPWSPPAEWKTNGSINGGGTLNQDFYGDFTEYLRRYAQIMYEKGAPIYSISMQNEYTYSTANNNYEGCEYTGTQHANWWKQAGNFLNGVKGYGGGRQIPKVQAMSGEAHNEITALTSVLANDVRNYIDILGRHNYGTSVTASSFLNNAQKHPTDPKETWMTEKNINSETAIGYPNDSTWNYVWPIMNELDFTIRLNFENAYVWWTAKRFYSFIGDATFTTTDGDVLPRGHGLSHFAKFAKETGRVNVTTTTANTNPNYNGPVSSYYNDTNAKITAFVTLNDDFYAKPVETRNSRWMGVGSDAVPATLTVNDIQAISLVMYTPTSNTGANGQDLQIVKIQLPAGFIIRSASAMRSNSDLNVRSQYEEVRVGTDKNSAYVDLPASTILSVRFTK